MRLKKEKIELDYNATKAFFDARAEKYTSANPYGVTMYQDDNSKMVYERNQAEAEKILPYLQINSESVVLDIACGVGRWADILEDTGMKAYYGLDFDDKLINIAKERVEYPACSFFVAGVDEIKDVLWNRVEGERQGSLKQLCNRILLAGILCYLNDKDIVKLFSDLNDICDTNTKIYIRVPVGIDERLTLKDFYSDELKTEYHAIYRMRDEYYEFMESTLLNEGFYIEKEGYLFEDASLNDRAETRQYFFVLSRKK